MKDFFLYVRKRIHEGILHEMLGELKWIYRWSMHYKGAVIWYICLGVFGTGMGLGVGVVSKYIIDAVTGYDSGALLPAVIGYGSMSLFQIGVTAWSGRVSEKIRIMVNQEIRLDVFNKVLMSDWQSLSRFHSGDLLNRLNGDVNTVASSVIGWIPNMVTGLVRFFATLALILYYDPTMAVLALLSAPITLAMSSVVMRKMRFHNQRMLQVSSEVMSFNEEAFQNIPYIKSFGLMKKYDGMLSEKAGLLQGRAVGLQQIFHHDILPDVGGRHGGVRGLLRMGRLPALVRRHYLRNHDIVYPAGRQSYRGLFHAGQPGAGGHQRSHIRWTNYGYHGTAHGASGGHGGGGKVSQASRRR